MAGSSWKKLLAVAALWMLCSCCRLVSAQSAVGSLTGRLTDLYSKPLSGVTVMVRNQATGAEARTTTDKRGVYRFSVLEPGAYTLDAESAQLGHGHLDGIVVGAGHEAHVQSAIAMEHEGRAAQAEAAVTPGAQPASAPAKPEAAEHRAPGMMVAKRPEPAPQTSHETQHALQQQDPMRAPGMAGTTVAPVAAMAPIAAPTSASHAPAPAAVPSAHAALNALLQPASNKTQGLQVPASLSGAPEQSTVLSAAQLQALPLAGRNWQNFVLDSAPAATDSSGTVQSSPRGGEEPAADTVDGVSIRLAFGGSGVGRMRGRSAALIGPGANEAAIREVQSVAAATGVDASRAASRGADEETASGTNRLHGQAFLLDRDNLWGAQNPFTQWVRQTAPGSGAAIPAFTPAPYTPRDRAITWGFGAGGRFRQKRLFWFAALDSYHRNDPGVSMVRHPENFFAQPTNDQMQVLSARLGLSSADPVTAGVAAFSPLLQSLAGLLGPASRASSQWTGFLRGDWQASERNRLTLEGTGAQRDAPGGGMTRASEMFGNHSYGSSFATEQWLLGRWESFLTPNLLLVTQGSFGHQNLTLPAEHPSAFEQGLNINAWGQLPQIRVDSRYGFAIGDPARFGPGSYPDEHLYQAQEQANWAHGPLLVKSGFSVSHNTDATSLLRNRTGTYDYYSLDNFASDALAFAAFGIGGQLNPMDQHNCDETGRVWHDSAGTLRGLGYLPCYTYYSQTMGPSNWWLSTNDWASYTTVQWQPQKQLVLTLAMRWERQQMPSPIARLRNPDLPLTETVPSLGNQWGPRASLAWGTEKSHWPVLRLGYGMYFGRTPNLTIENALTQTGSSKGDQYFFMRPTDNLAAGGAPPFPYVLAGEPSSIVMPGAVEFSPNVRNGQVHQAQATVEEDLPGRILVDASAEMSLARHLPMTMDANIDPAVNPRTITYAVVDGNGLGPLKTSQITVPFFASWPSATSQAGFTGRLNPHYQQVTEIFSRANSTYEAATLRVTRYGLYGLALHARYAYAHAMDWNPSESVWDYGSSVFDPTNFRQEYGNSSLDVRHAASVAVVWQPRWKLRYHAAQLGNGWMLSGIGYIHSGLPYSMRTAGSLAKEFDTSGAAIVGLAQGMNGYGGDNRVYGVGRNTFRYPGTWKADLHLSKRFNLGEMRQLELLAETFNLFNHQNVTELETVGYTIRSGTVSGELPSLNFLTGLKTGQTEFGQPLNINATNFYRERQIQFGMRLRF
ncbi:MAG: carboxypeptidase regulatory-like domain-containing protein [Terracidiphilus sp.]